MGAATSRAEKRRILVVDDVELNRVLTEAVLRGATYEVDSVGDGRSALAALEDKTYDLVLMDLEMPGLDGHETAAAIRHCGDRPIRLAAISSQCSAAIRLRSAAAGMSAHIARPIAPRALLREIERAFCQPPAEATPDIKPDPWHRQMYEDWVKRLGAARMLHVLEALNDQFRSLLMLIVGEGESTALHRLAHDVASTGGMLGFPDVTRCCRATLEAREATAGSQARSELGAILERAIARLDRHFATIGEDAAAA